jgi:hypothetical protein
MESAPVGKAAVMSNHRAVRAAKVPGCGPIDTALAQVPARTRVADTAIGVSEAIALRDAITYVTRRQATGASLTEIAASDVALGETLLNLPSRRALTDIPSRALESVCYVRVVVAKTAAKARIVYPSAVADAGTVEMIPIDEVIVYKYIVTSPSSVPAPVVPASSPNCAKGKSSSPG